MTQDMGVNLAGVEVILDLLEKMQRMQESMESEIERLRETHGGTSQAFGELYIIDESIIASVRFTECVRGAIIRLHT